MKKFIIHGLIITICTFFLTALANALPNLRGRILLQVERQGQAWYVEPVSSTRAFLGRPADAFAVMRGFGLGISNSDLNKLAKLGAANSGDQALSKRLAGRILLQVQSKGEAWYLNPVNLRRYYLGRPTDAFNLMRSLGLGITNHDLSLIPINPRFPEPATSGRLSATLNWNANLEPDLAGYRVFYDTVSHANNCPAGFRTQPIDVGNQTNYKFYNLPSGQTYYFQIVAYDSSGNQSTCSPQVSKLIP